MYARITVSDDDGVIELEFGTEDRAAYPDEASECVARVVQMWREVTSEHTDGD